MDPITLITSAPPEWMPALIIIALLVKAWTAWVSRQVEKANIEITQDPDVRG